MKKILFLTLLILLVPLYVRAENVKVGATIYSFEELEEPCSKAGLEVAGYDEFGFYCYQVGTSKYFNVDSDGNVTEYTLEEYLNMYNAPSLYYSLGIEEDDNKIYSYNSAYSIGYIEIEYDKLIPGKSYYTDTNNDGNLEYYYSPEDSSFVFPTEYTYYESYNMIYPKSMDVSTGTYYECDSNNNYICNRVSNPVSENILNYRIIDKAEYPIEVGTVNAEFHKENLGEINGIYKAIDKEEFYLIKFEQNGSWTIYDTNGKKLFENIHEFEVLGNGMFSVLENDVLKIYNNEMKLIKSVNDNMMIFNLYNINNKTIIKLSSRNSSTTIYYAIRSYELTSDDIQKYDNKDLTIEFSGSKEDVKGIKVNDQELSKDNYTFGVDNTTIILNKAYLETLKEGTYTLSIEYNDGVTLTSKFIVPAKVSNPIINITNPDTGDKIISSLLLGSIALIGIFIVMNVKRKQN